MATPTAPASGSTPPPAQGSAPAGSAGQAAPPASGGAQPAAAEMRKLKLKLEGQEVEMSESEVIALAQQGKVANKRFQEASQLKKQAEDVLKFAKENPTEFFNKTGMNARQWAEEYLMGELKREQMSPEQRKAEENEGKLKKYENEEKAAKEKARADEMERLTGEHRERLDKLFVDALGKSGLPKTAYTIRRMAELQLSNIKNKFELSADQLAKVVREDYIAEQKALFGSSEGDQLLDILGPELAKKLSKAQLAKLKAKGVQTKSGTSQAREKDSGNEGMTWREYQRKNRRLT